MAMSVKKPNSAFNHGYDRTVGDFPPGRASGAPSTEKPTEQRVPSFVPWIAIAVVAMTALVVVFSPPNSHVRRSLCAAFASISAANCLPITLGK
jgi:hypothetical protein